ncbi:MAG: SEC-C metal-binding domain-containing protein [Desulfatiglandaceae bacterium]
MNKIGRNDLCPCGSGKKFKKCHLGKEEDLIQEGMSEFTLEMSQKITDLPQVRYGRSGEMVDVLDLVDLTGTSMGIRFIDLHAYEELNFSGGESPGRQKAVTGGVVVNIHKTVKSDPDHIYVAITPGIGDSALIHEMAHVLDYLAGSKIVPGLAQPLSFELGVPLEHVEHPHEFGYWLMYLKEKFDVILDADDRIIIYLYDHGLLIKGADIERQNAMIIQTKSEQMLRFLSEHSIELDALICERPGYIGSRVKKD